MKRRTKLIALLTAVFVSMVLAVTAVAHADNETYTIRVFDGGMGTLSASPVTVEVNKGDSINLYDYATATITEDRYIQTGFKLTGTSKLLGNGVVNNIVEDMDFTVAYTKKADAVAYTIRYVEYGTGKELAPPQTFYGENGSCPVVAPPAIECFSPRQRGYSDRILADMSNEWTLEYDPLQEEVIEGVNYDDERVVGDGVALQAMAIGDLDTPLAGPAAGAATNTVSPLTAGVAVAGLAAVLVVTARVMSRKVSTDERGAGK